MMTDNVTPTQAEKPRYLLMKRDLYYGPNDCGYTGIKDKAGRYFETDAMPDCGVTAIHEDDAPEFSKACFADLAIDHLQEKVATQAAEIARLKDLANLALAGLAHEQRKTQKLRDAAQNLIDHKAETYTARNGRKISIEADDGELCWIIHSDPVFELEAALSAQPDDQGVGK